MYFTEKPVDRKIEKAMTSIPNFYRPSSGLIIYEEVRTSIPCSYLKLIRQTMQSIQNRLFLERFQKYISERKNEPMKFRGQWHESLFKNEVRKLRNPSASMLTALYLLTADNSLWSKAKHYISHDKIVFDKISLSGISLSAYTLYNAAITLCSDKEKLSINELADRNIVPSELFGIICEAMTLRRYGVAALNAKGNEPSKSQSNYKKDGVYQ